MQGSYRHRAILLACGMLLHAAEPAAGAAAGDSVRIDPSRLPSTDRLRAWHAKKDAGGPTFSGSPAWQAHMRLIESGLRERGVVDLRREPLAYRRWYAPDDPAPGQRSLRIGDRDIPVASYWAYSGATAASGVTAPLVPYDRTMSRADMAGRIVVFDVGGPPESMASAFVTGNEHATADLTGHDASLAPNQWFQGNFVTRFGRFDTVLKGSGAAGAIVVFDMSPGRARGLYTFPLLNPGVFGVPGVYVDRVAGADVRAAARARLTATLTLVAHEEEVETWFLSGFLPGRDYGTPADEAVLLVTHSDGPNLTQVNGTFGILGIVDYFARTPRAERRRSLFLLFDPQHYMPGRHTVHWYKDHPAIVGRIVASVGVEQLGQSEFAEDGNDFELNGKAEPTLIFAQDNVRLVDLAIAAVKEMRLPRTEVRVPSRGGQGMWAGLGDFAIRYNRPGFALSSAMSGYWTTTTGIESFDAALARRQIGALVMLTQALMDADLGDIAVPVVDPGKNPAMSPGTRR
ncbi:MAG: hypothetical protein ACE5G3_04515 [Gammaproteobacteria bacterium]